MNDLNVLYQKFDIETHKRNFANYLEVVILEDGTIEYAVPSHQEKLIKICAVKLSVTRDQLLSLCPKEYHFNFIEWLCMKSGAIPVWERFYIGSCNPKQERTLQLLKSHGLYKGDI